MDHSQDPAIASMPFGAAILHKPVFLLFLGWYCVLNVMLWCHLDWPVQWQCLEVVLPVLSTFTLLIGLGRRLPAQNVIMAAVLIFIGAAGVLVLSAQTGIPFGYFHYSDRLGQLLFGVIPLIVPAFWVTCIVSSRGIARLIMRPWRKTYYYGIWVILLTVGIACVYLAAFEPFASGLRGYWFWRMPAKWWGVPPSFAVGAPAALVAIIVLATPWLINKQPVKMPTDYHPMIVWFLLMLYYGAALALRGAFPFVSVLALVSAFIAFHAVRGGQWGKSEE